MSGRDIPEEKCYRCGKIACRRERDINRKWTGKYICIKHYQEDYDKYNKANSNKARKLVADRRIGNLRDHRLIFADNCQKLTCEIFGVDDLNEKNNNYNSPIDHSRHHKLGILQTKGAKYDKIYQRWSFGRESINKNFDNIILWCASKDGLIIERGYIIPKILGGNITIIKNPTKGRYSTPYIPWYEKYRIKNKELFKKINVIWSEIINKK